MKAVQEDITHTNEIIAACHGRVVDAFATQSNSRECIRLSHQAIARSREQIGRAFQTVG